MEREYCTTRARGGYRDAAGPAIAPLSLPPTQPGDDRVDCNPPFEAVSSTNAGATDHSPASCSCPSPTVPHAGPGRPCVSCRRRTRPAPAPRAAPTRRGSAPPAALARARTPSPRAAATPGAGGRGVRSLSATRACRGRHLGSCSGPRINRWRHIHVSPLDTAAG